MIHLSRLAEDWILYSSEEFGWLELGDGVTSGSSLMPQKKNPDSLELIRGKCGRVMGSLTSLMVTMKGLPMTYNRDMQEDKVPLFEAADQLAGSLEMARVVIESVKLNAARARRRRRGELGRRHRSRRSPGARRHAVPPGPPDCRTFRPGKRPRRQASPPTGRPKRCANSHRNSPAISRRCSIPKTACDRARYRAAPGPNAVAAALAAAQQRLAEMSL